MAGAYKTVITTKVHDDIFVCKMTSSCTLVILLRLATAIYIRTHICVHIYMAVANLIYVCVYIWL